MWKKADGEANPLGQEVTLGQAERNPALWGIPAEVPTTAGLPFPELHVGERETS